MFSQTDTATDSRCQKSDREFINYYISTPDEKNDASVSSLDLNLEIWFLTCSKSRFGLVILTSRFEATRGLLWDGPRNFEPRSNDEEDTRACTPSPNFHATPTGGRSATTYDLTCNRPHTRRTFSGIGFRTWNPLTPRPRPYH
ncbi:hypothetical protein AVEN_213934-1 [Araneus ventricosus]|uniref:Uncharacterized protein n=1 Tax=Araneus ventricosus TaxID=182803 RepID=A0A4Y2PV79_ARAVE|nr:hypothetical protein AVEN_213934-1 [Araneus ventricosus]